MKKVLRNASFEESKEKVTKTKNYIVDCFDVAVYNRYVLHYAYLLLANMIAAATLFLAVIAWEILLRIPIVTYLPLAGGAFGFFFLMGCIYFFISLHRIRDKKLLFYYHINRCMNKTFPIIWISSLMLLCTAPVYIVGVMHIAVIWIVIVSIAVTWIKYKYYHSWGDFKFGKEDQENIFIRLLGKFLLFLKKHGWIFVVILVLFRTYIHRKLGSPNILFRDKSGIIVPAICLVIPALSIALYLALGINALYHEDAYFLEKYFEEFRIAFGFTQYEWYDLNISKEKIEEMREQEKQNRKTWKEDKINAYRKKKAMENGKENEEENLKQE